MNQQTRNTKESFKKETSLGIRVCRGNNRELSEKRQKDAKRNCKSPLIKMDIATSLHIPSQSYRWIWTGIDYIGIFQATRLEENSDCTDETLEKSATEKETILADSDLNGMIGFFNIINIKK